MNARTASRTLVIAAGLWGAAVHAHSAAPAWTLVSLQPGSPPEMNVETTDFVQAWVDLSERYQPPEGKDAQGPDAWGSLLRAISLLEASDQKVWKTAQKTPPDYTLVYSKRADEKAGDGTELERAAAFAMIQELGHAQFDAALDEVVARYRAVRPRLDSKQRAAELKEMGIIDGGPFTGRLVDALLPELGKVRQMTRVNLARMHQAVAGGNWDQALRCFEQNLAMARVVSHQPMMIDRLVAVAVASVTLNHVRWHIMEAKPSDAVLAAMSAAMDRQLRFPPLAISMEGEQLMALDGCKWAFSGKGPDAAVDPKAVAQARGNTGKSPEPLASGQATRQETVKTINDYYALVLKEVAQERSTRGPLSSVRRTFEQEHITERVALMQAFMPPVDRIADGNDQLELEIAGTRAMIAVERSQRATGTWPAALTDAVKEADLKMVADPWSTKMPVKYRRLDAADSHDRNYLIYSVGVDGEDNHGKELEKAKRFDVLNKPLTVGADFVVNVPRE